MKRILLSLMSVLIIAAMLLSLKPLSYLARPIGHNRDIASGFYSEEDDSLDMIYIGGSACFVYWQPLRAWNRGGFTSYNFAHDAITPQALKYYIQEAQKTQNPSLYVVDLRPFQYGELPYSPEKIETPNMYYEVPVRNGTDCMNYSANRTELIDHSVLSPFERLPYYFDLMKYHQNAIDLFGESVLFGEHGRGYQFIDNTEPNEFKGFKFLLETDPWDFCDYSAVEERTPLTEALDDLLIDLLEYCKGQQLQVLFIVHAYGQLEEEKRIYNYLKDQIEAYGCDYLNANDYWRESGIDYSLDMANRNHVNVFGAEKYTDFLCDYILSHYEIPDHRGDVSFEEWNTLYESFAEQTIQEKQEALEMKEENGNAQ